MGPVPQLPWRHTWDRSHSVLRSTYGADPIGLFGHYSTIWDRSHSQFSLLRVTHGTPCLECFPQGPITSYGTNGTSPIDAYNLLMGLVPQVPKIDTWDFLDFSNSEMSIFVSKLLLGSVPLLSEIYTWDRSHRYLRTIHGTQ